MGRRKSMRAEETEELGRRESRHDNNRGDKGSLFDCGGGNRSRHDSNDSESNDRQERVSRAPSRSNLYRSTSKAGSSFHRPSRPDEGAPKGYVGFHFPSGDQQQYYQQPPPMQPQLEPLPGPRNAMPPNGSGNNYPSSYYGAPTMHNGNMTVNGYHGGNASMNSYGLPRNNSYERSPMRNANASTAVSAPLTRRASQVRINPDVTQNGYFPSQQSNVRYPTQGIGPSGTMNTSVPGYQQPPSSPVQQYQPPQQQRRRQQATPPRVSIDLNQMMQSFRNLPQLPYVVSQYGPVAPPPFPFPYPDAAEVYQLLQQQQMQMHTMSQNSPPVAATSPPPQQHQQLYPAQLPMQPSHTTANPPTQQQQRQPLPPSTLQQRPLCSPQGNGNISGNKYNNSATNNMNSSSGMSPVPAPVSPSNGSGGNNPAGTGVAAPFANSFAAASGSLHRTTSILKPVSSFRKQAPVAGTDTTIVAAAAAAAPENSTAIPQRTSTSPSGGSILNRVSSFKKNASSSSPSPAPSAVQAAQRSPSSVPPQHSAAATAAKAAAELPPTGILRRKSFFATAAAAGPEPELTPEERDAVLKEKLAVRELERQRLEAEHRAREEAAQKLHEQRLRELREAQATEAAGTTTTATVEEPRAVPAPTVSDAKMTPPSNVATPNSARDTENKSESPHESVSRASSYSFSSMATTRSGRSAGTQPPLPQLHKQPQSPIVRSMRTASPTPDIGDYYYKGEVSGTSSKPNRNNGLNRTPTTQNTFAATSTAAPVEEPRVQQRQPLINTAAATTPADARSSLTPSTATPTPPKQLWHRCPSLVLYEVPLRCRRTTNEKGEDVIDDANFAVHIAHKSLCVTDSETQLVSEYPHDEFVTHRKGSTNVESKLLNKVCNVVVAGYTASVLSLDAKGLAKPTSAFDSATWMAKQRLIMNLINHVEKMQTIYTKNGGMASSNSSIEVSVSIVLVKKVSVEKATEWRVTNPATRQRTFEVVDLLQPEPIVVPFRMHTSVLFGNRVGGVEYKSVSTEADFTTAMASAQRNANIVLGRLADAAAVDPNDEDLAREKASVFEVLTCVVRHRKEGAVALADQLKEAPRDVFARGNPEDIFSSDEEDDDARLFDSFNSHNGPSSYSDMIVSCLTCIGVRQNVELWGAALERKEEMAPSALFNTAFGGPAYTVILASIDPTKHESAETLSTQAGMTIKLHRRPTNGSASRLIQCSKYQAGAAQKELDRPVRPSGAEQRELKSSIRKSAATLDSLEKALAAGG